jgi:dihydroxyacetone kinase phosphotransfer subunit
VSILVGIVIVSHSEKLAAGVVEIAKMTAPNAPLAAAGGLDDGGLGTSYTKISEAIDEVYSEDGVAVLMDMGSAVMTTEIVIEDKDDSKLRMLDCLLVEGAVLAAVESTGGISLDELAEKIKESYNVRKFPE